MTSQQHCSGRGLPTPERFADLLVVSQNLGHPPVIQAGDKHTVRAQSREHATDNLRTGSSTELAMKFSVEFAEVVHAPFAQRFISQAEVLAQVLACGPGLDTAQSAQREGL